MTSDASAQVNPPVPNAALRHSPGDLVRAWAGLLLAAAPTAVVLTLLLYGLGLAMGFGVPGIIAVVWFLICAAVAVGCFLGAGRREVAARFGLRPPTDNERIRLSTAWARVAQRAAVPASAYSLWIRGSGREYALPNRLIAVGAAGAQLPPAEVEAVLAHALCTRYGQWNALCQLVFRYYNLPFVWLEGVFLSGPAAVGAWLTRWMAPRTARGFTLGWNALSRILVACPVIAAMTVMVGLPTALLLRLVPEVASCALVPIVRRIEFQADRTTVDLGYGPDLGAALQRRPHPQESVSLYALSVSAWNPRLAAHERVSAIRDRLDDLARAALPR